MNLRLGTRLVKRRPREGTWSRSQLGVEVEVENAGPGRWTQSLARLRPAKSALFATC